jgi:hypothetical protein
MGDGCRLRRNADVSTVNTFALSEEVFWRQMLPFCKLRFLVVCKNKYMAAGILITSSATEESAGIPSCTFPIQETVFTSPEPGIIDWGTDFLPNGGNS